jgi:glycosyltransferase involved in cell wall biosynthesis
MRFAFVTTEYPGLTGQDGGLARYIQRMARTLTDAGHESLVFLACADLDPTLPKETRDGRVPIFVVKLPAEIPAQSPLSDLAIPANFSWVSKGIYAAWSAGESVAQHHALRRFDAVQVANLLFLSLFQQTDAPLILRFSSYEPMLRSARGEDLTPVGLIGDYLEREGIYCADRCFAPSAFLARMLGRELRLPILVNRPPAYIEIPESQWDWSWWKQEIEPLGPYLAFGGYLSRAKGCHVLAKAFSSALRHGGGPFHLHLAGRDQGELAGLKAASPDRIHYHGSLPHERLYPLLARSVAVMAPSLVENLSNSVIEGMLLGRPVVATEGTSGEELLSEGRGILVRPGDVDALTDGILQVVALSEVERMEMGQRARSFVEEEFSQARSIAQWLAMVDDLRAKGPFPRVPAEHRLRKILPNLRAFAELEQRRQELVYWKDRYARVARQFPIRQLLSIRRRLLGRPDPLAPLGER